MDSQSLKSLLHPHNLDREGEHKVRDEATEHFMLVYDTHTSMSSK